MRKVLNYKTKLHAPISYHIEKTNSKETTDLNINQKNIKLLEENLGVILCDLGLGNGFLDMTLKAKVTREKVVKLDFIKVKNFCASKDIFMKMRR